MEQKETSRINETESTAAVMIREDRKDSSPPSESGSIFATLPAVILFFLLAVAAGNAGMTALSVFLFGAFLISLAAFLWAKFVLRRLILNLEGSSRQVFPGTRLSFRVRLKNDKLVPLSWLEVSFPVEERSGFPELSRKISWVLPHQEVAWEHSWQAERRGILHVKEASLYSGDGFGLTVRKKQVKPAQGFLFVIYPEVRPVNLTKLPRRSVEQENSGRGYQEDVSLLKSSRGYLPGDSSRRINWRILAGTGRLESNQYETILPGRATVILDLESFSEFKIIQNDDREELSLLAFHEKEMEEMISLAASLIVAFADRKERTALVLPRTNLQDGGLFAGEDPEQTAAELLTALAGIRYAGGKASFAEYSRAVGSVSGEYLVLSRNSKAVRSLRLLQNLPEHFTHIILCEKETENLPYHTIGSSELYV